MTRPIFIFSLPRAGSTLLQRILMTHEEICSVAEPWVLLPQFYALKSKGTISEYSSYTACTGITDFIENLPNKRKDYNESLRAFILELYNKQCRNNENYFLDKTPRYYLIIDDIVEVFPDAKFIFLFRNPVHVFSSLVNTWGNGRFNKLLSVYEDIYQGVSKLSLGYLKHKNKSIALKYEDIVKNPVKNIESLFEYLGLEFNRSILDQFALQDTKGSLGDPTGSVYYSQISSESLNKWEITFNSMIRKRFVSNLVNK